jgi:PLP dependent protein
MGFQVSTLQEIVGRIQYYCKLNFKNRVDIDFLLDTDGLEIEDINQMISAGVRIVGFSDLEKFIEMSSDLLPCKKHYIGDLDGNNLTPILTNFDLIESINDFNQVRQISDYNARHGKITELLIRMNVLSDIKKFGFSPAEIQEVCISIAKTSGVRLLGVTSFVPNLDNDRMKKTALRKAGTVFKLLNERFRGIEKFSLNYLTQYEDLVAEGVTEIRIGVKDLD